MALSRNERLVLEAIRDDVFDTVSQVAKATGLPYQAARYNYWRLMVGGLVEGFEVTYAGHKELDGVPPKDSDLHDHVSIRTTK